MARLADSRIVIVRFSATEAPPRKNGEGPWRSRTGASPLDGTRATSGGLLRAGPLLSCVRSVDRQCVIYGQSVAL
jgi:hypothetical protein